MTCYLKHGMMTVRPAAAATITTLMLELDDAPQTVLSVHAQEAPRPPVPVMALLSFLALERACALAFLSRPL